MGIRNWFKPPQPAVPPRPATIHPTELARPRAYQPVAAPATDALDAEIIRRWLAFQKGHQQPRWEEFLAELRRANTDLASHVARDERTLSAYAQEKPFVP